MVILISPLSDSCHGHWIVMSLDNTSVFYCLAKLYSGRFSKTREHAAEKQKNLAALQRQHIKILWQKCTQIGFRLSQIAIAGTKRENTNKIHAEKFLKARFSRTELCLTGTQSSILRLLDIECLQITLDIIEFIIYDSQSD